MILTISLFFLGICTAFAMIARKVWMLRTGQIVPGSYEEADWTDVSVESVRARLLELLKFTIHYTVLFALKAWILASYLFKRTDRYIRERLARIVHKHARRPSETGAAPSEFLQSVMDHKDEMTARRENDEDSAGH